MSFLPGPDSRPPRCTLAIAADTTQSKRAARPIAQGIRIVISPVALAVLWIFATVATAEESKSAPAPTVSPAATFALSNCNDSGVGSLRDAVASAASGDTIILKTRGCDHIRLTSGAILIDQDDLTLLGPGPDALLVSGNRTSQVFRHDGSGTLRIKGTSIGYGRNRGRNVYGGCIQSRGNLQLKEAAVHHCLAHGGNDPFPEANGGGVYAAGDVSLVDAVLRANRADAWGAAEGGALFTGGRLTMTRSQIRDNVASGSVSAFGGARVAGGLHAYYSEISGNQADYIGGIGAYGEVVLAHSSIVNNQARMGTGGAVLGSIFGDVLIVDSTVSRNSANTMGGLSLNGRRNTLANSTVAFNQELTTEHGACEGGLHVYLQLHIESSIVARNYCNGRPLDITAEPDSPTIIGADSLVELSAVPLPPDTISSNPDLLPLGVYGGPTRTHALQPDSPAIDSGNNVTGLEFDQRGRGFARVKGPRADIGAYESAAAP